MKRTITILLTVLLSATFTSIAQVGINTDASQPDNSAMLDVKASDKGILIPRIALTDTSTASPVSTPASGLIIYNTSNQNDVVAGFYYWNGSKWLQITDVQNNKDWHLYGNTGTTPATDFIGTTDAQDLVFKTNNTEFIRFTQKGQIKITNTGNSVFIGNGAGDNDDLSDNYNVFIGNMSGFTNTAGGYATAVGYNSLYSNASGDYNTAIGGNALYTNSTGNQNTATGFQAMYANTIGSHNVAFGINAMKENTEGNYNSAFGAYSLFTNTTGGQNSADGYYALYSNTTGEQNTANGNNSLKSNTTGNLNTAVGFQSLYTNNDAHWNVAVGANALYSNASGQHNIGIGFQSLYNNTAGYNVSVGNNSLYSNSTGQMNSAVGFQSLNANTTGSYNVAVGTNSLIANTEGADNIAIGYQALKSNTTHNNSTAVGHNALQTSNGDGNTALGYQADTNVDYLYNAMALGYNAVVTGAGKVRVGNTSITEIGGEVAWSTLSDGRVKNNIQEDIPGLAFILKLRPISYHIDVDKQNQLIGVKSDKFKGKYDIEKIKFSGFIAQEVEQTAQKINYDFSSIHKPQHSKELYSISYAEFVVPLVKAVQEQQQQIEELKKQNQLLMKIVKDLQKD